MSRGISFSCSAESISLLWFLQIVMVIIVNQTCDATTITHNQTGCPPSSCGKITNIKHPFRLKDDPTTCGDKKYELSCENNTTLSTLLLGKYKYCVKSINYIDYTIRVVDPGIKEGDCSSIPHYFLTRNIFKNSTLDYRDPYHLHSHYVHLYIVYLKCSKEVKDDPGYVDTAPCRVNSDSKSYVYAFAGQEKYYHDEDQAALSAGRLKDYCKVKLVSMSSLDFPGVRDDVPNRPLSYEQIHGMLLYGFQLSWLSGACRELCGDNRSCSFYKDKNLECDTVRSNHCTTPLGFEAYKRCDRVSKRRIYVEGFELGEDDW